MDDYNPTPEDIDFLNQVDMGYVGLSNPRVVRFTEPYDKYLDMRIKASRLTGIPMDELPDEPDRTAVDFQGWS